MRIFYENLVGTVENVYIDKSTLENVLYLEDIVRNTTTDIYAQYKYKTESTFNYSASKIDLNGVVKIRNSLYFVNYYRSTYNNFTMFNNNNDNYIVMRVTNTDITHGVPQGIDILLNNVLIEHIDYEDEYTLYNRNTIQIQSAILGTTLSITFPLYMNIGEEVKYTLYTINVTEETALHKYLCTFDRINNALIFDRKYKDPVISIIVQSKGSILRSSTINELYRLNANSFVQYDENNNRIAIPIDKLYKDGSKLKYIKSQQVQIDPTQIPIGYALIGIYLDPADYLTTDVIIHNVNYATLMESVNNYNLDTSRKSRQYYGFVVGLNNINKFTPTDVHLFSVGAGGSGTSGVEKIMHDFTSVEEIIIEYIAGTEVPTVSIFDDNGYQVVPQETHYNYNNEIKITFGESFTGQVSII